MPWSPEPSTRPPDVQQRFVNHPYVAFYEGVLGMAPGALAASRAGQPRLDEPRSGQVEGAEAFTRWAVRTREWLLDAGAAIPLQHCTVTDDGVACALEWNATMWGRTPIEPQAGIAVYERGQSGRLASGRIDDDLTPPEASDSSELAESGSRHA
jgi:hypothetical protein